MVHKKRMPHTGILFLFMECREGGEPPLSIQSNGSVPAASQEGQDHQQQQADTDQEGGKAKAF